MKILLMIFALILSVNCAAQTEKTKQQWLDEAKAEGEKLFKSYHAICGGKVVVRTGKAYYYEFSGSKADVYVFGLYHVFEADRLNGKLWSGKMEVEMGDSARGIEVRGDGTRAITEWDYGREAEFDLIFADNRWQLTGQITSFTKGVSFYLKPGVSCKAAGL